MKKQSPYLVIFGCAVMCLLSSLVTIKLMKPTSRFEVPEVGGKSFGGFRINGHFFMSSATYEHIADHCEVCKATKDLR